MAEKIPNAKNAAPDPASSGNVEQIREILFGAQIREFQQQFNQLEARISQAASRLHQDIQARVTSVEQYAQGEIDRLNEQLKQEREARLSANQALDDQLDKLNKNLNAELDRLDGDNSAETAGLRQELHDQVSLLQGQLRTQQETTLQSLDQETARLQRDKLDQSSLADLFKELGARIQDDNRRPANEVEG